MSTIEGQHQTTRTPALAVQARGAVRRLRFRWSLSAPAAAAAGLVPGGTREANLELLLDVTPRGGSWRAAAVSAAIEHDGRLSPLESPSGSGAAVLDAETGLLHIDIDGFIHATLRGEEAVLYARSPLLARLGLAGGRYERDGLGAGL
jgi:hypothetical protein